MMFVVIIEDVQLVLVQSVDETKAGRIEEVIMVWEMMINVKKP